MAAVARRVPTWKTLHAEADRLYPQLRALWRRVFTELQGALDLDAVQAALVSGSLGAVEAVLLPAWTQIAEATARTAMVDLLRGTVARVGQALAPALSATLGVTIAVRFGVVSPEALAWIEQYAGAQIQAIGQTTLEAVRAIFTRQFTEGRGLTDVMRELESQVGLTPRQTETLARLRLKLLGDGVAPGAVRQQVEAAARKALQLRVEAISRTESITASLAGQDQLWHAAERQGFLNRETFRRFWVLTFDDRLCPNCRKIPGMNPDGVRLDEPFITPVGSVMFPTAHPL